MNSPINKYNVINLGYTQRSCVLDLAERAIANAVLLHFHYRCFCRHSPNPPRLLRCYCFASLEAAPRRGTQFGEAERGRAPLLACTSERLREKVSVLISVLFKAVCRMGIMDVCTTCLRMQLSQGSPSEWSRKRERISTILLAQKYNRERDALARP